MKQIIIILSLIISLLPNAAIARHRPSKDAVVVAPSATQLQIGQYQNPPCVKPAQQQKKQSQLGKNILIGAGIAVLGIVTLGGFLILNTMYLLG